MGNKVYEVIRQVSGEMAKTGISKDNQNQQQKYKFRGIDDVYNALAPLLAEKGLIILPRLTERTMVERTTKNGGAIFNVTVKAEFDFVAAEDGSLHTVATYGEAMDTADKATNKAMSAAYKYACFMTFCIPTEGDNDADSTTHEVNPTRQDTPKESGKQSQSSERGTPDKGGDFATVMAGYQKTLGAKFFDVLGGEGYTSAEEVPTDKQGLIKYRMKEA